MWLWVRIGLADKVRFSLKLINTPDLYPDWFFGLLILAKGHPPLTGGQYV